MVFRIDVTKENLQKWADEYPRRWDTVVRRIGERVRSRGHLLFEEYLVILLWKASRASTKVWDNDDHRIESRSRGAFSSTNDRQRLNLLRKFDGAGARVASAILHFCVGDPFSSADAKKCSPILDVNSMVALGFKRDELEGWSDEDWAKIWPEYASFCRDECLKRGVSMRVLDRSLYQRGKST